MGKSVDSQGGEHAFYPGTEGLRKRHPAEYPLLSLLLILYVLFLWAYFVPVFNMPDEHGYHVSARIFSETGGFSFSPPDEYSFIGRMWIVNDAGKYVSKYPPFYPLLAGVALRLFGHNANFLVNPACALLVLLGVYALSRALGLGAWSLLAVLFLAVNPVFGLYALRQFSHPSSLASVTWGYALYFIGIRLAPRRRRIFCLVSSGLLMGCAVGIRYTNLLLVVPLLLVLLFSTRREGYHDFSAFVSGFAIPMALLGAYHWKYFGGPFSTGYSLTEEQTAFGLDYLAGKLKFVLVSIGKSGLGPVAVLSVPGFMLLWGRKRILSVFFLLWIIPLFLVYTSYYWKGADFHFLRVLLPVFIPMILLGVVAIKQYFDMSLSSRRMPVTWSIILVIAVQLIWGVFTTTGHAESSWRQLKLQKSAADVVTRLVPEGSVIFSSNELARYLDFTGAYFHYSEMIFDLGRMGAFAELSEKKGPMSLQKKRAGLVGERIRDLTPVSYEKEINDLLYKHADAGRAIYAVTGKDAPGRVINGRFRIEEVADVGLEIPPYRLVPLKRSPMPKERDLEGACRFLVIRLENIRDTGQPPVSP